MPDVVRISARQIDWPLRCACCLEETDDFYEAEHTRVTGKRVINTDTRAWNVPCCGRCLHHAQLYERAMQVIAEKENEIEQALRDWPKPRWYDILFWIVGFILLIWAIATESKVGLAVVATAGAAAFISMMVLRHRRAKIAHAEATSDLRTWKKSAIDAASEYLSPTCCRLGPPVDFEGWDGHVQTFTFWNDQYAAAFQQQNHKKIV